MTKYNSDIQSKIVSSHKLQNENVLDMNSSNSDKIFIGTKEYTVTFASFIFSRLAIVDF